MTSTPSKPTAKPVLYVGNKNYSSWSLRPFLALRWAGVDVDVTVMPLQGEGLGQARMKEILAVSPSGRVPALQVGDVVIWDSLAICEWAAEQAPDQQLWPTDSLVRAEARAATCEMHAGFAALRRDQSMNIRRRVPTRAWPMEVAADIARITALWTELRTRHGARGPWLFGQRTIADAFYAPVVARFRTYGVPMEGVCAAYSKTVLDDAAFREWEQDALKETWTMPTTDALYA